MLQPLDQLLPLVPTLSAYWQDIPQVRERPILPRLRFPTECAVGGGGRGGSLQPECVEWDSRSEAWWEPVTLESMWGASHLVVNRW